MSSLKALIKVAVLFGTVPEIELRGPLVALIVSYGLERMFVSSKNPHTTRADDSWHEPSFL